MVLFAKSAFCGDLAVDTLKSGLGIRAMSMGGAFTAVAEEGPALFYNPAGLTRPGSAFRAEILDYKQTNWDQFTSYYAYLSPFGYSQWQKKDKDGRSVTVQTFGYGKRGSNGVDWGLTYKLVNDSLQSKQGWSTDFGLILHPNSSVNLGIAFKDLFKDSVQAPATLAAGLAVMNPNRDFILSTDFFTDRLSAPITIKQNVGLELHVTEGLFLRGGYFEETASAGATFQLPIIELSYGVLVPMRGNLQPTHMVSITIGKGLVFEAPAAAKPAPAKPARLSGEGYYY